MTPFLKQIAKHYIETAEDISRFVFVFPSHRAQVFFRKYLTEVVRETGHKALIAPKTISIDEFFGALSGRVRSDRLTLTLTLYNCYKEICEKKGLRYESLDEFIFWGDVILNDFDDVDKYMIGAADIFRNVNDLKSIEDDFSYLSDTQREALGKFIGNFKEEGEFKMRFARLWNILGELYVHFNSALDSANQSYTGKLLRDLTTRMSEEGAEDIFHNVFPDHNKVVFCGLNVLCACENKILASLRNLGLAEFCWDYQSSWIKDPHNKSSLLMEANLREFPQAMTFEPLEDKGPEIEVVNVPSGVGQTKLLSTLLEDENVPADEHTAIVLPDETLLQPLLNSIPPRIREVNVTMGYSMACSSFFTLLGDIAQLQLSIRRKEDGAYFYHRPFWNIVSNNVFDALLTDEERETLAQIKAQRRYYIPSGQLEHIVMRPVLTDPKSTDAEQIRAIQDYQLEILQYIGSRIAADEGLKTRFSLELDFAMEYIKSINLIAQKQLSIMPKTYFSLLEGSLRSKSIPIKGEPLTGLQIMGPLETRALDFDHLFVLSCNEGMFPRASQSTSFIPPLLRKGFDLPTYEYQDAVWAYYFYRMIQRPSKVVLTVDTRSEGMQSGEQSRYIKQLQYHFTVPVVQKLAVASPQGVTISDTVAKTPEHVQKMHEGCLSASMLQNYLACSMKFYYSKILGLKAEDEINENMRASNMGNVYHKAMELLYSVEGGVITREYVSKMHKDKAYISQLVEKCAKEELRNDNIKGRDIVLCTMICKYVCKTLERDLQFMDNERVDSFRILGLEKKLFGKFGGFNFMGFIDRLDSFHDSMVRVVDYKTGQVEKEDTEIDDGNAATIADMIFGIASGKRPKIALQCFIYDMLLDQNGLTDGKTLVNSVYNIRSMMTELPANRYRNSVFKKEVEERLAQCLADMENTDIPFQRTEDTSSCAICDFRNICGR